MTSDALTRQVGGNHYARLKLQPMEFTMTNGWDSCAHTILKYTHRHADKNGVQDLEKALHTCDLRETLRQPSFRERAFAVFNGLLVVSVNIVAKSVEDVRIPMERYISMNGIDGPEAEALLMLETWVECQKKDQNAYRKATISAIKDVIRIRYGEGN